MKKSSSTKPAPPPAPRARAKASPLAGPIARGLAWLWLWWFGWKVEGSLPPGVKAVAIAAPHTTNWDMPFMLAVAFRLGVRPSWLGKREIFRRPFGGFMRWLGGIPVDRSARGNLVAQVVESFQGLERLFLVIPPSGTRKRASNWKSGFYHIARGAEVPIICTFLDYRRKVGGVGLSFVPTDDLRTDMDRIREFYKDVQGLYPDQQTPMFLPEEEDRMPLAAGASTRRSP